MKKSIILLAALIGTIQAEEILTKNAVGVNVKYGFGMSELNNNNATVTTDATSGAQTVSGYDRSTTSFGDGMGIDVNFSTQLASNYAVIGSLGYQMGSQSEETKSGTSSDKDETSYSNISGTIGLQMTANIVGVKPYSSFSLLINQPIGVTNENTETSTIGTTVTTDKTSTDLTVGIGFGYVAKVGATYPINPKMDFNAAIYAQNSYHKVTEAKSTPEGGTSSTTELIYDNGTIGKNQMYAGNMPSITTSAIGIELGIKIKL